MANRVRVLTVNTHKGFTSFNRRFILHELRDSIRMISADIVFLQEVLGEHTIWEKRFKNQWPEKNQYEFLADEIWDSYAYGRNAIYPEGHHGNAFLSKFPITSWDNYDISMNKLEKRGLLHCQISFPKTNQTIHTFCVHLSLREQDRKFQLKSLCDRVNKIPEQLPVIVAGDFNDWRQRAQGTLAKCAGLNEAYAQNFGKPARTFPTQLPILRLDRIYVRSVGNCEAFKMPTTPWSRLSDHRPLLADISI